MAGIYFKFTVPNAYQKFMKYVNGGWELNINLILYGFPTRSDGTGGCATQRAIVTFRYNSLKDLYLNKNIYVTKVTWLSGQQTIYNAPIKFRSYHWSSLNSGSYNLFFSKLTFEILGRMCHLLGDMSVPAHSRNDIHGSDATGIRQDTYEKYFGYDFYWNANSVYYNFGGPFIPSSEPLHFLLYTTAQLSNYFGSNGPYNGEGNNFIGGNYNYEEFNYLNNQLNGFLTHIDGYDIRAMRGNDNEYTPNIKKYIRDKTFPHTIRATAGLLYWFANECGLIPSPPTISPVISNFTQSPKPIYQGTSGTVTCNLSQGNGNLNYNWSIIYGKPGVSVSFYGDRAEISYNSNSLNFKQSENNNYNIEAPVGIELQCSVYNSIGSDVKRYVVDLATTPHGCPFVYTWNGETWVEDNNILPQSQDSTVLGQDVTDFYQLYTKPILDEGKYYLAIGEFEEEISYLDQLKLLVVDHPQETFITVDDNGEIIQFAKPAYFANAQLDSIDVYKKLVGLDSIKAEVSRDETLSLSFEDVSVGTEKWLLLIGQQEPIYKDKIAGSILRRDGFAIDGGKENTTEFSSFRLRKNPTYQWVLVPDGNSSSLQVDIAFNSEAEIDYTELSHKLELPFTVYTPQLLYAEHSVFGDVTSLLNQIDEQYSILNTDEMITLEYSAPPIQEGMERTIIFVSRGRYERLENNMLAKGKSQTENKNQNLSSTENPSIVYEYGLSQNFPNPFNPVTTISYQLKDQGLVQLKVYNSLGQEIVTLVNEVQSSGIYETLFDASNLPSGVYIYSLKVNDFVQNNKMTLLK